MAGCSLSIATPIDNSSSTNIPFPAIEENDDFAYPIPSGQTAYPVPSESVIEDYVPPDAPLPVVSEEAGAIKLTVFYPGGDRPVRGKTFFAAEMLPVEGELAGSFVPALDTNTAPGGESDRNGVVTMSLITPGKYALVLMTPLGPILVTEVSTEEAIIFDVLANHVTELETLTVLLDPDQLEP